MLFTYAAIFVVPVSIYFVGPRKLELRDAD